MTALHLQQHQQHQPQLNPLHVGSCGVLSSYLGTRRTTLNNNHHQSHHQQQLPSPITLDLFSQSPSSLPVELDSSSPLPFGWQKFLYLKTGETNYKKCCDCDQETPTTATMSRNGKTPKLDLRLNLSPPPPPPRVEQQPPRRSGTPSPTSTPSSCVSSENSSDPSTSPGTTSMMLAGCPRCLMYVMLSEDDPKCPKCKSNVLLDFSHDNNINKTKKN